MELVLLHQAGAWDMENSHSAISKADSNFRLQRMACNCMNNFSGHIKFIPARKAGMSISVTLLVSMCTAC
jgi:hypothetical protein